MKNAVRLSAVDRESIIELESQSGQRKYLCSRGLCLTRIEAAGVDCANQTMFSTLWDDVALLLRPIVN